MALIKSNVPEDFKNEVVNASKSRGISESKLIQTAVRNFLKAEPERKEYKPIKDYGGRM
jgi:metal-responsive CopG/Arc/MetJ family transcriptional regulator